MVLQLCLDDYTRIARGKNTDISNVATAPSSMEIPKTF